MPAFSKNFQFARMWKKLSAILTVALIYFLLAKFAFYSSDFAGNVMAIWPASGFALAVVLVYGKWMTLGAGIGSLGYNWHYFFAGAGVSLPGAAAAIVIAAGSMLEFVVAAYLIRRNFPILAPVTLRDVTIFILIAVVSGSIGACFGSLGLALAQGMDTAHYFSIGFTWWLGDTTGILIVTPPLLIWKWPKSRKGLLFPLIAPCAGLTLIGFFIVHQFEDRLLRENLGHKSGSLFSLARPGGLYNSIKRIWLSWNVLFGGAALTCILGVYLESNRREQMALQESEERLKTQSRALSRLTRTKLISSGDLPLALKVLTETTAATLRVERASGCLAKIGPCLIASTSMN